MGISDRHYFAWLRGALERFEGGSRRFDGIRRHEAQPAFWVLAWAAPDPATEFVAGALGPDTVDAFSTASPASPA